MSEKKVYNFDTRKEVNKTVEWIKRYFKENGPTCNALVGMSGGKDSFVTAMLCIKALGKERVLGLSMPMVDVFDKTIKGESPNLAIEQCEALGIDIRSIDVLQPVQNILYNMYYTYGEPSENTKINLPARIRMSVLYAVAQSTMSRVACTSNLSEDYIGWSTRWGDMAGDFQPLANYTATEVLKMMKVLTDHFKLTDDVLPEEPTDGLCGKTDEEAFGFTYEDLDKVIRGYKEFVAKEKVERIEKMHKRSEFKLSMPAKP